MPNSNHTQRPPQEATSSPPKKLGGYLVEAGLLTPAQVDVVLNDQKITGMRFGEILAARGWVKQQTVEYLMQKVVLPEQKALQQALSHRHATQDQQIGDPASLRSNPSLSKQPLDRREPPITKPLPSVPSDEDVSWVG